MNQYSFAILFSGIAAVFLRGLHEDVKFVPSIRDPWRSFVVAVGTALSTPVFDSLINDRAVLPALLTGLMAALPSLISFLTSLLANKTVAQAQHKAAVIASSTLGLVLLALGLAGCPTAGGVVCPILKAADELCPFVIVQLTDGGTIAIPRSELQRTALEWKAAHAWDDGGTK